MRKNHLWFKTLIELCLCWPLFRMWRISVKTMCTKLACG